MRNLQFGSIARNMRTVCKLPFKAGRGHLIWTKMLDAAKSLQEKPCHWRWSSLPSRVCSCAEICRNARRLTFSFMLSELIYVPYLGHHRHFWITLLRNLEGNSGTL